MPELMDSLAPMGTRGLSEIRVLRAIKARPEMPVQMVSPELTVPLGLQAQMEPLDLTAIRDQRETQDPTGNPALMGHPERTASPEPLENKARLVTRDRLEMLARMVRLVLMGNQGPQETREQPATRGRLATKAPRATRVQLATKGLPVRPGKPSQSARCSYPS